MFRWMLTTGTTAAIGLALMTLAWLDNATYYVA